VVRGIHLADISPDGTRIVTASWDGMIRVWPVDPLKAALSLDPRSLTAEERKRFLEPLEEGWTGDK